MTIFSLNGQAEVNEVITTERDFEIEEYDGKVEIVKAKLTAPEEVTLVYKCGFQHVVSKNYFMRMVVQRAKTVAGLM